MFFYKFTSVMTKTEAPLNIDIILSTSQSYRDAVERGKPYSSYAPLTLIQLEALVPEEIEANVRIIDLTQEPMPSIDKTDIVAISSITCGIPYAYALADKARASGKIVVIGGAHATALPEEVEMHADAVVVGYAEKTWPQLLRDVVRGKLQKRYTDFSNPFNGPAVIPQRGLNKQKGYIASFSMEASRGCPNGCSFCTTKCLNDGQVYLKSIDAIEHDLDTMGKTVLLLDSNITENHPPDGPLFSLFAKRKLKVYASGSIKFAENPEQVHRAAQSGLKGILIGFESIQSGSLTSAGKGFNNPEQYKEAIKIFHDNGIIILGCFVFGLDDDDPGIFERTAEFVEKNHIDIVRYSIATPLPGTQFFKMLNEQNRIFDYNWEHYDTEHVVFQPARMSPEQLSAGLRSAYRSTYRLGSICRRLRSTPASIYTLFGNIGFRSLAYTFDGANT